MACSKTCSLIGNQHVTTFDSKSYLYHGGEDCKYIFSQVWALLCNNI